MRTKQWTTKEGKKIRVMDMSDSHLVNTIKFLRKAASARISSDIDMAISTPPMNGEMAQELFEQGFEELLKETWQDRVPTIYLDMEEEAERRELSHED